MIIKPYYIHSYVHLVPHLFFFFHVHTPQVPSVKGDQQPLFPVDGLAPPDSEGAATVLLLSSSEGIQSRGLAAGVLSVSFGLK